MTEDERKLLVDHKKMLAQFRGFVCSSCHLAKTKKIDTGVDLGQVDVFRPTKHYTLVREATYVLCDACMDLPAEQVYAGVEAWLMDHGHLKL